MSKNLNMTKPDLVNALSRFDRLAKQDNSTFYETVFPVSLTTDIFGVSTQPKDNFVLYSALPLTAPDSVSGFVKARYSPSSKWTHLNYDITIVYPVATAITAFLFELPYKLSVLNTKFDSSSPESFYSVAVGSPGVMPVQILYVTEDLTNMIVSGITGSRTEYTIRGQLNILRAR